MTFFFHDIAGLIVGTLATPLLGMLPGFALLLLLERAGGLRTGHGWERFGWALLLAFTVLPAIDALAIRFVGMPAAFSLRLLLALAALRPLIGAIGQFGRVPRAILAFGGLWWLAVAISYVDVDWDGHLYQSLVIVDLVKHAAVIQAIVDHGVPLRDSFFARAQPAGYYYYFYCLPAEIHWAAGNLIDARMAFASSLLWQGLAIPALIYRIGAAASLIRPNREKRFIATATLLCFVAGAGLPCVLIEYAIDGKIAPQLELWTEEVRFALTSVIWVPHHIGALIACWMGALFLCSDEQRKQTSWAWADGLAIATAGLCFASAFGMSVWITLTALPIFICWAALRLMRRDYRRLASLTAAGIFALLISLPQMLDMVQGRSDANFPISLTVRSFAYWALEASPSNSTLIIFLIATLPIAYAIQFGYFTIGSSAFLRLYRRNRQADNPVRSLLAVSAIISLIVASFLCSTIINNDLGWRSIWFAQLAAMVWTTAAIHAVSARASIHKGSTVLLMLGLLGNIYDVVGLRILRRPYVPARGIAANSHPATDFAERQAYEWAASHLDANAVIQHNADIQRRVFDFGLYGHNRVAVADAEANLFGANRAEVIDRLHAFRPIFYKPLPLEALQDLARQRGVGFLLFTDVDPVWKQIGGPPFPNLCIYRNAHVCLLPTKAAT